MADPDFWNSVHSCTTMFYLKWWDKPQIDTNSQKIKFGITWVARFPLPIPTDGELINLITLTLSGENNLIATLFLLVVLYVMAHSVYCLVCWQVEYFF